MQHLLRKCEGGKQHREVQFWGGERGTEKHTRSALSTMCVHFTFYQGKSKGLTHTHTHERGAGTVCSQLHKNTQKTTDFLLANISWLKGYTQDPTQFSTYFVAFLVFHTWKQLAETKQGCKIPNFCFLHNFNVCASCHSPKLGTLYSKHLHATHLYVCRI